MGFSGHPVPLLSLLLAAVVAPPVAAQAPATPACGPGATSSSYAVVGIVRRAEDRAPAAGATVLAEWLELSLNRAGFMRQDARVVATASEDGSFALCDVPRPGTLVLSAGRGADSTDRIELEIPASGTVRRDLYIGRAWNAEAGDEVVSADTLAPPPRRVRAGDGRLSGFVVTAADGRPLAGALITILDGPATRANEAGEWTLAGVPAGTRTLEVRAVGYYPEYAAVDVLEGAPPVRTTLATMAAVLEAVRVTASRASSAHASGFAERRQTGMGRYITQEYVTRYRPIVTSDLFRFVPGVYVERTRLGDDALSMRGIFSRRCSPAVYLDGHYMRGLSADDVNAWVGPEDIAGIEVYSATTVPAQFQPGMSGCGSIVIWTQARVGPADARPLGQRFLTLVGAITLGLILGATLR